MATLKSRLQALLHEVGDAGGGTMLEDAKRVAEAVGLVFRNVKTLVEEAEQNLFGESRDAEPQPEPQHLPPRSFLPLPPRTRAYPSEAPRGPARDEEEDSPPAEGEAEPPEEEGARPWRTRAEDEGAALEDEGAALEDEGAPEEEDEGAPAEGEAEPEEEWVPPDDWAPLQEWLQPDVGAADVRDAEDDQPAPDAGGGAVPSRGPSDARKRQLGADAPGGGAVPSRRPSDAGNRSEDRRAPRERNRKGKDKGKDKSKGKGKGKDKEDDVRPGDWRCEACGFHNFARNDACKHCGKSSKNSHDYPSKKGQACKRFCIMWMTGSCKNAKKCTFAHAPHELTSVRDLREGSWLCEKCGLVLERKERGCSKCKVAPTRTTLVYDERKGDFSRRPS